MAAAAIALEVRRDHPAYDGHFPGDPVLPGVVILAEVLAAIGGDAPGRWEVASVKFLAPVAPGTALTLQHQADRAGALRFEVRSAAGAVAQGTLTPRP